MGKQSFSVVDESRNPMHTILMLSWPILLEQLLVALVQAADTAMVGSLGAAATAAVAINYSPNMLLNGVVMALGVGFTSLVGRSVGARDFEKAKRLIRMSIVLVFAVGFLVSLVWYFYAREIPMWMGGEPEILDDAESYNRILSYSVILRSMTIVLTAIYRGYGDSKTPMLVNGFVNVLNVIGNFFMIFPSREMTVLGFAFPVWGMGLGVSGAAISTSLSGALGGLLLMVFCFTRKSDVQICLKDGFGFQKKDLASVFHISFPAMLERFTMGGAFIIVSHTVATLGTAAVAAQNLSGNVEALSFMPGLAFGAAATTLFAQSLGAERPDLAHDYVIRVIKLGCCVMAVTSIFMFAGSSLLMRVFTPDPEVIGMGAQLLKILALIQVPQVIAMVYSGALKGAGDSRSTFLITLISMWGVRILGSVISVHIFHLGIASVCVAMCADNIVRCLLFHLRYRKAAWKEK